MVWNRGGPFAVIRRGWHGMKRQKPTQCTACTVPRKIIHLLMAHSHISLARGHFVIYTGTVTVHTKQLSGCDVQLDNKY